MGGGATGADTEPLSTVPSSHDGSTWRAVGGGATGKLSNLEVYTREHMGMFQELFT